MRKFSGIVLIIFGCILGLMTSFSSIIALISGVAKVEIEAYSIGYCFGQIIFVVFLFYCTYLLFRTGIRLTKNKLTTNFKEKIESIK